MGSLESRRQFFDANPRYGTDTLKLTWALVAVPFVALKALQVTTAVYDFAMMNPVTTMRTLYWVEVVNDSINESIPPMTPHGAAFNIIKEIGNYVR